MLIVNTICIVYEWNMNEIWTNCEQNNFYIILSNLISKLDISQCDIWQHYWTIAIVKWFYLTYYTASLRQVFLLDRYNLQKCSIYKLYQYLSISIICEGVFYIIKHLFDCETRAMCSTHTSRPKSHITLPHPFTS